MGECLVKLTYVNEGDSFLAPYVHDQVLEAHATLARVVGNQGVYLSPNLTAVAGSAFPGDAAAMTTFVTATIMKGIPVLTKFTQLFISGQHS